MRGALRAWPVLTRAAAKMRGRFRLGIKLTIEVLTLRWGVCCSAHGRPAPSNTGKDDLAKPWRLLCHITAVPPKPLAH